MHGGNGTTGEGVDYLTTVTNTSDGHFPSQHVMPNLCVILIQLVKGTNLEEEQNVSVLLLDIPVLFLRVCSASIDSIT